MIRPGGADLEKLITVDLLFFEVYFVYKSLANDLLL